MDKKYSTTPEQAKALEDLKKLIGKSIPLKNSSPRYKFGVYIENNNVIGLGLKNLLLSLPESIGNLTLLRDLNLSYNRLKSIPESIGKLESLEYLYLNNNELEILPELMGDLSLLKIIELYNNKFPKELPHKFLAMALRSSGHRKKLLIEISFASEKGIRRVPLKAKIKEIFSYIALINKLRNFLRDQSRSSCWFRGSGGYHIQSIITSILRIHWGGNRGCWGGIRCRRWTS